MVNTYADLASLTPSINNIAQVANRGNGQYSVYQWSGSVWNLVGIEDGTIQFNSNLYTTTVAGNEIRILFETLQNNIFINELAVYFNVEKQHSPYCKMPHLQKGCCLGS